MRFCVLWNPASCSSAATIFFASGAPQHIRRKALAHRRDCHLAQGTREPRGEGRVARGRVLHVVVGDGVDRLQAHAPRALIRHAQPFHDREVSARRLERVGIREVEALFARVPLEHREAGRIERLQRGQIQWHAGGIDRLGSGIDHRA